MKFCKTVFCLVVFFCFPQTKNYAAQTDTMKIKITSHKILDSIPSCSGVEFYNNAIYICGDNSPYLFKLSDKGNLTGKFRIKEGDFTDTIPKKMKPDYESITLFSQENQNHFLIFGSGSLSPQRDYLLKVNADSPENFESVSLSEFYKQIRSKISGELNLEGACIYKNYLYLLNRADNNIIRIEILPLLKSVNENQITPPFELIPVNLSVKSKIQPTFSGAALIPGTSKMIFTATTEDTPNAYDDGINYGSYIGVLDLEDLTKEPVCIAVSENNSINPWKVESLSVIKSRKNKIDLVMVTDNDGKASELIFAELSF